MTASLILASTSPTRAALLRSAGLTIETTAPRIDEEEVKLSLRADGVAPRDQADMLAEMKASRVSNQIAGILTLGADQVLECEGRAFDKPSDMNDAAAQLRALREKTHTLHSAAVISLNGEPIWRHIAKARLTMRPFSEAFLKQYLDDIGSDALTTAGAYKIEAKGAQLFSQITGDYFGILGLPLVEVLGFLRVRGTLIE